MSKLRQVTAWKPGKYRGIDFSLDDIKQYVDGTNQAIAAGIPVPLLKRHATIGANDSDTVAAANLDGAGWIKKLEVTSDGHIAWEAEDVPEGVKKDVEAGVLKFTSPEFRKSYSSEKEGVYTGPIIRHFAFTPLPGNPHQGKITDPNDPRINEQAAAIAMSEELKGISRARQAEIGCFQFDESDLSSANVPDPKAKKKDKEEEDKADHDLNTDMGKGSEGHSIDKDVLADDEEYFTDDAGKQQKRKKETVSAHAEGGGGRILGVIKDHGWKHKQYVANTANVGAGETYVHPKHEGLLHVDHDNGKWHHFKDNKIVKSGMGHNDLDSHLGSQHAENPIANKDGNKKPENDEPPLPKPIADTMEQEESPPTNPDMPPKATDKSKLTAVVAGLKNLGVVLPSDFDINDEHSIDLLLTGLNTAIEAKNQAEMEDDDEDDEEESPPQESAMPYEEQFSEEELAALPPKARAAIEAGKKALDTERKAKEEAESKALAFAEEERKTKNNAARDKAKDTISKAKIPPSLRGKLLEKFDVVQFSEGREQPAFTVSQIAELVANSMPKHLVFSEDDSEDAETPKAKKVIGKDPITGAPLMGEATEEQFFEEDVPNGHVSANRAEELVRLNPALPGFNRSGTNGFKSISDLVAEQNALNPNNVKRGQW